MFTTCLHRHPLYGHQAAKSRKRFLARTVATRGSTRGKSSWNMEELNWLSVAVPRCKTNLKKWVILPVSADTSCDCGAEGYSSQLCVWPLLDNPCTTQDVYKGNDKAIAAAIFWKCWPTGHGNEWITCNGKEELKTSELRSTPELIS